MKLSIKVDTELVRQGLEELSGEFPKIGRRRMRTRMEAIKRRMQEYPPEPAHRMRIRQHPVLGTIITKTGRTGLLGHSWVIDQLGTSGYSISNNASRKGRQYGSYVVGDAYGTGQAWMHQGRWQVLRDVVEEEIDKLPEEIQDDIVMVARRIGFEAK